MTDNVMDKTKERADMASHETRESYERDSCRDDKSAANAFKTAGVEGQNRRDEVGRDEVKNNEYERPSDLKGADRKAGLDLK